MNKLNGMNNDYILRKSKVVNDTSNNKNAINNNSINKGPSFQDVLNRIERQGSQDSSDKVKFSKHASNRLQSRNITLTDSDMERLESAVSKAQKKGIKDALILMDKKVFIASIKNKTIVTASTENDIEDNVFTNIDGAVIV